MNNRQHAAAAIGLLLLLATWIYPPWLYTYEGHTEQFSQWAGYYLLFQPPMPYGVRLDMRLLLVEWAGIIVAVGGLLYLLGKSRMDVE